MRALLCRKVAVSNVDTRGGGRENKEALDKDDRGGDLTSQTS